jgi:hypothetical protein
MRRGGRRLQMKKAKQENRRPKQEDIGFFEAAFNVIFLIALAVFILHKLGVVSQLFKHSKTRLTLIV